MTKPEYIQCHLIGHKWDDITGLSTAPKPKYSILHGRRKVFRCERCFTFRFDVRSTVTGDLMYRKYGHPDGYKIEWEDEGSGLTFKQSLWVEYLKPKHGSSKKNTA